MGTDLIMNQSGSRYILPANEVLTHDADGNLTGDGHWTYSWDAENRLTSLEEKTSTRQPPGLMVRQRLEFRYDAGGRRIAKKVLHAEGNGTFVLKSSQVFLYDGWNMIGELQLIESGTGLQPVIQRTYEWGPDVSGSFTGAGGVGGLILLRQVSQQSQTTANNGNQLPTSFAPLYDGNGNVTELCALSTSTVSSRYEYSAFGETITTDGSAIADSNPFRFSTKYEDRETGFYYYGYRYYAHETGRWLSRDPIGEKGGLNLYGMVGNDALNRWDRLGLDFGTMFPQMGGVGPNGPVSPPGSTTPNVPPPNPPDSNRGGQPGPFDQLNPLGLRGNDPVNYNDYFESRFSESIAGAKSLLKKRIREKACEKINAKPYVQPVMVEVEDVDIKPDGKRFGDAPQGFWEKNAQIGFFEVKAKVELVKWHDRCSYSYTAEAYVEEITGANPPTDFKGPEDLLWFTGMFAQRNVEMARWDISEGFQRCPDCCYTY